MNCWPHVSNCGEFNRKFNSRCSMVLVKKYSVFKLDQRHIPFPANIWKMRISELSPDIRQTATAADHLLSDLETSIRTIESLDSHSLSSFPQTLILNLKTTLSLLQKSLPFPDPTKIKIWKLSYRLWNSCVDLTNQNPKCRNPDLANLRQIAADLLVLAGYPTGIPNPEFKAAGFYYKTGLLWLELRNFELASVCLEKATDLVSKVGTVKVKDEEDKRLALDINLARSMCAWELGDKNLAVVLLNRAKSLVFGSGYGYKALAEQFLKFGKIEIADNSVNASNILNEALDVCEKGIQSSKYVNLTANLMSLKEKCLRFIAAERLQAEDYQSVLKCVKLIRSENREELEHASIGYIALKALLGLGRVAQAEKELKGMMGNGEVPENVCVSASELYLESAGAEAAMSVLMGLVARCRAGAGAALRIVKRVMEGRSGGRAKVVSELVADERVVAVFEEPGAGKERSSMHAILWNWGADHFRLKEYNTAAELFEKSMLYISRDEENRNRRSNCFRVLSLCHLALNQLDQAQEYIDQAEKLEPNIRSTFLKFKIHLQKMEEKEAMDQIQAMVNCIDFDPEYLTLSTHEAISCHSLPVAISLLSTLLNLYAPNKEMPLPEVTVLRNLITLLYQIPDSEQKILKYTRRAHAKMKEHGIESFFGKAAIGSRELSWFAGNSWNVGLKFGKEKNYEFCAESFELASEFYIEMGGVNDDIQFMACKSLILSVGAMINAEEHSKITLTESYIKKAMEMLNKAGKLLAAVPTIDDQQPEMSSFSFLHTFNSYSLLTRVENTKPQQMQLIKTYSDSKSCTADHLLQLSRASANNNPEASEHALKRCLSLLLASPTPDYYKTATVIRHLALLYKNDAESAFNVYKQAHQIIIGLNEGEYPTDEGKWLATTAWNRGGMAVRLRQVEVAKKWMKMGLDLARHVRGLDKYVQGMEESFANFEKICSAGGALDKS